MTKEHTRSNETTNEISTLLQDEEFTNEVIQQAVASPGVIENLAAEIADELSDLVEDDPQFRNRMVTAALKRDDFKQQMIDKLVEELND